MAGRIVWAGSTLLAKQPESGRLTLADRTTLTDVYRGPYWLCWAGALARGTYGTGLREGWVVSQSDVESEPRRIGKLTITWEAGGEDATMPLPCDDFDIQPVELYPKIERHPLFQGITIATLSLSYGSIHGSTPEARDKSLQAIKDLEDSTQKNLGLLLVDKLMKGEETFYLAGMRYQWIWFSYSVPNLSFGGFLQSPAGPGSSGFPNQMSWLRLADAMQPAGVNGSMYKITETYLGGPVGHWDEGLYS